MERWTFLSRLFARFRHIPTETTVESHYVANATNEFAQLWSNRFKMKEFQPKSLPTLNYEEIINGQIEDFSADCWLDGHIHRFADASDIIPQSIVSNERICVTSDGNIEMQQAYNEDMALSSEEDITFEPVSSDSDSNSSFPRLHELPVHHPSHLLDLFVPMYETGPPPPYSEEPPPTYEEATASSSFFALSGGSTDLNNDCLY